MDVRLILILSSRKAKLGADETWLAASATWTDLLLAAPEVQHCLG